MSDERIMKVEAIIRPDKLSDVKKALSKIGAPSLTVSDVSGRGSEPDVKEQWRGEEYIVDLHQKTKVECVVGDVPADEVVDAIEEAVHTGNAGDGKIFVYPIENACRIRTGERGTDAV